MTNSPSSPVKFAPRWKEEMVGTLDGREFVFEFTMGVSHAYLPTEENWEKLSPTWARDQWTRVHDDLVVWCKVQKVPMTVDEQAWVSFPGEGGEA